MTTPDQSKGDRSRDEVLAGEYVLGVLGPKARREVEDRMQVDRRFAATVSRWRENLAHSDDPRTLIPPPRRPRKAAASGAAAAARPVTAPREPFRRLWRSLPFWRGVALASVGAILAVGIQHIANLISPTTPRPVAELSGQNGGLNLVANYDPVSGMLRLSPVAANGGHDVLEMWLIRPGKPPASLGLLRRGVNGLQVPPALRGAIAQGGTISVSREPLGGAADGVITGPVLVSGDVRF